MNKEMQQFARKYILENLVRLPDGCTLMFKKMYATHTTDDIENVVAEIHYDKLDWAMSQIQMSISIEAERIK